MNKIPTGKKHGKVWDANTKLATGKNNSFQFDALFGIHAFYVPP
jgi:hypothetical protein